MRISDWSSDVCSSDLSWPAAATAAGRAGGWPWRHSARDGREGEVHGRRTWIPGGADSCSVLHGYARAFISYASIRSAWCADTGRHGFRTSYLPSLGRATRTEKMSSICFVLGGGVYKIKNID